MVEVATLEASTFVAAVLFPSSLLLPASVSTKCLLLVKSYGYNYECLCEWNGLMTGQLKCDTAREVWRG
jgi:hypothetical protein